MCVLACLHCSGNFKPGGIQGTVLKKASEREQEALERLMVDRMKPFVPQFYKLIVKEDGSILFIVSFPFCLSTF